MSEQYKGPRPDSLDSETTQEIKKPVVDSMDLDRRDVGKKALELQPKMELLKVRKPGVYIEGASLPKDLAKVPNQDAIFADASASGEFVCAMVADGVGSLALARDSSQAAKKAMQKMFESETTEIDERIHLLNMALREEDQKLNDQGITDAVADTTFTALLLQKIEEGGKDYWQYYIAHVGDSRCYRILLGKPQQLTLDHNDAQEAITAKTVTPEQAKYDQELKKTITRSLRTNLKRPTLPWSSYSDKIPASFGHQFILATDGYTDQFLEGEQNNEIAKHLDPDDPYTADEIIAASVLRTEQRIPGLSKNDDRSYIKINIFPEGAATTKFEPISEPTLIDEKMAEVVKQFSRISGDTQLKAILAYFTKGNLDKRYIVGHEDISTLLKKFPTRSVFETQASTNQMLNGIERNDGAEKRAEYEQKLEEFKNIVYGELSPGRRRFQVEIKKPDQDK